MTDPRVQDSEAATSSSLLVRVKAQDQQAWRQFVHLYSPLVYHWCRRVGLQQADASDVGQEVFKALTQRFPTLELTEEPVHREHFVLRGYQAVPVAAT